MPYTILKDIEQGIAALIDPEAGRSLGPILQHDDGVEPAAALLEAFVGGLGVDPATLVPHRIDALWDRFLETLNAVNGVAEDVDAKAAEAEGEAVATPAEPLPVGETAEADLKAEEQAALTTPGPLAATDAPADDDGAVAAPTPGLPPTGEPTVGTPMTCTKCDGFLTVPNAEASGSVPCDRCNGSGQEPPA